MLTATQICHIRRKLDYLATSTWHKIEVGPRRGLTFNEESITDHNLFELDQTVPGVEVYKFNHTQEGSNGADFEWYIGGDDAGWVGLRFQAKKYDDGHYEHIGHWTRGQRQYDLLLRRAAADRMWPFYCFYNGWTGGWPTNVVNATCEINRTPTSIHDERDCKHARLEHFGCALVPAGYVAGRHSSKRRTGRLAFDDYLSHSRPWSHIFSSLGLAARPDLPPEVVLDRLTSKLTKWFEPETTVNDHLNDIDSGLPDSNGMHEELPAWLAAARRGDGDGDGQTPALALVYDLST